MGRWGSSGWPSAFWNASGTLGDVPSTELLAATLAVPLGVGVIVHGAATFENNLAAGGRRFGFNHGLAVEDGVDYGRPVRRPIATWHTRVLGTSWSQPIGGRVPTTIVSILQVASGTIVDAPRSFASTR